ncbi:alpha/beta hydrolase fold domain-containing protein [Mizugakiibacter sediminis]|uniref:Alpha/beta hydrolase fold domain-containing protein n=1 Tax=Mizugakiibacter sediminis TaxID=1475481 RepID=A0A0K8QJ34_9GAMM|nr:alpha/beta fold hydrolase [Mizugakiibacter sediminis]GAP64955.1 alpha/beta hydrolase fold domain-containing protein [Mizugakiibacter sediminis]
MTPLELELALPATTLAARAWGDAAAPPLLALHGWLDNAASFDALAPRLAARFRVIALDLPGHGRSAHLPAGTHYHFVDYLDAALGAAEALGLERFRLLGHSLGAGVASLLAAAAPQRIERLALIEGLGPIADDPSHTLARFRDAVARRRGAEDKRTRLFARVEDAVEARVRAGGLDAAQARPIVERGVKAVAGGYTWSSDPRLTLPTPLRIEELQLRRVLAGIEAPALLLLADPPTPYLPTAMMDARAACVADIRVQRLPGGHHLHLDATASVAEALLPFLA